MHWFKNPWWNRRIARVGVLILLTCLSLIPCSAASAQEKLWVAAPPATSTVQATPTEDATVTALNKEKLVQEVQQLKAQNEPDLFGWLQTNASTLISMLAVVIGGLIGLWRWLGDRQDARKKELEDHQAERERRDEEQKRWLKEREAEREKRAEERFQSAVEGLSSDKEEARLGAAILLRAFLRPGYEPFYVQVFDLVVVHLRLLRTPDPPDNPTVVLPTTMLSQALVVIFKEAFPLARSLAKRDPEVPHVRSLDATGVHLDQAYLWKVDLKQAFLRRASLREANLFGADLRQTNFSGSDFRGANLIRANFSEAYLRDVNFSGANLREANFSQANLGGINTPGFRAGNFSGASLKKVNFRGAYLKKADFSEADLAETNIEEAFSLEGADLRRATGLTKEQRTACKAKGAMIDEDPTPRIPQSTVALAPPGQSNASHISPGPSSQGDSSPPDINGSRTSASHPNDDVIVLLAPPTHLNTSLPDADRDLSGSSSQQEPEP